MYSKIGQPNVEIGQKMANGQLLFLPLIQYKIIKQFLVISDSVISDNYTQHISMYYNIYR